MLQKFDFDPKQQNYFHMLEIMHTFATEGEVCKSRGPPKSSLAWAGFASGWILPKSNTTMKGWL